MNKLAITLRIIDGLSEWSGKIVSMLLFPMIGLLVYEVVLRYFFNAPTRWAHETSLFMFGTIGVVAGALCLRHGAHVKMDVVYSRLSRQKRAILDVITAGLFFFFCAILLRESIIYALFSWQIGEHSATAWAPPVYPIKTVVPVAAALLLLQGLANFIRNLFYAITRRELL